MQLLSTIYPVSSGMGLLLGIVHLLIWLRLRNRPEFLFASLMGFSAGVMALCEASFLGQPSLQTYRIGMEVQNAAVALMLISMVWFVRTRLCTGRLWLAWAITVSWSICSAVSIFGPGNVAFLSIDGLVTMTTSWRETFSLPVGVIHPLKFVTDLTSVAILIFVADATASAVRKGDRRVALIVGGPILLFIIVAGIHTPLVDAGTVQTPYIISLVFVAIAISLALGLVHDVAKSASLARQLQLQQKRWQGLLESVELAVVQTDRDGKVSYVNPYFEKLSERRAEELVGVEPWTLVPATDQAEVRNALETSGSWTTRARVQRRVSTASGKVRDLVWFSVALRDESGALDGTISIGQDISDQLQAEAERDMVRREIDKLTRVLTLGELASTFAHELSQPIAAVLSNAQTLEILRRQENAPTGELDEILQDILQDTRRARDLMQQIRGLMFNEAPEMGSFDLDEAIGEIIAMLSNEARRRGVEIRKQASLAAAPVFASRLELQQVFMNLLLNAIQAAGETSGGRVEISCSFAPSGEVTIAVDDTGAGLDAALAESVFDPFVTSKEKGTGIGLAVVNRIVQRHRGSIAVKKSALGGARFEVVLAIASPMKVAASG